MYKTPLTYKGKEYPNLLSLVKSVYKKDIKKNYGRIHKRLRSGYSLEEAINHKELKNNIPVIYKGKDYPSVFSLAKSIYKKDVEEHYRRIIYRLKSGYSLEEAIDPKKLNYDKISVTYKGKAYSSVLSLVKIIYKKDISKHYRRILLRLKSGYSLEESIDPKKLK